MNNEVLRVWRDGFAPLFSVAALRALADGLRADDRAILQGATTSPPPLMCVQDWPIEAADVIGYCGWKSEGLTTVGEVEEFFAKACFEADKLLGEPAGCRHFLNWQDDTPRDTMRAELLTEVERELALRGASDSGGDRGTRS
jgi:hypothetical protein